MQLSHAGYDALERAIIDGQRISVTRRGTEYIVVPSRLRLVDGREAIESVHPNTGDRLMLFIDEIDDLQVVE